MICSICSNPRTQPWTTPTTSTIQASAFPCLIVLTRRIGAWFWQPARPIHRKRQKPLNSYVGRIGIRAELEKLIRLNKTRADFAEKFEELIESYNTGSRNIEELFEELVKLSRNLSEEQQRHVRENMTEEELVIFDIFTRPAPELTANERAEVKKVARDLLYRLKQLLVLNWRQKSSARSELKLAIEDVLDTGLPRAYDKPLYAQKCSALFEHVSRTAIWVWMLLRFKHEFTEVYEDCPSFKKPSRVKHSSFIPES